VVAAGRRDQAGVVKGVVEEYTPSGRLLWRRSVSTGSDGDGFLDVAVARDGRVFASGASAFPATGDAGPYVVALQASGKVVWRSQWDHEGWGEKIVVSRSSVYVGATLAAADATDTELAGVECLNAVNGSTTWRRPYDLGSGTNDAGLRDLTVVPGQSVYIAVDVRDDATGKDAHFLRLAP
jgi:outer membrane protein assembly factor BamB